MGAHAFNFRIKIFGRAAMLPCDHCRGQLGVTVQRYWRMRFCSTACMSEYQQRQSTETQLKILTLVAETTEPGAVQLPLRGRKVPEVEVTLLEVLPKCRK
jgi:hypothetical protein